MGMRAWMMGVLAVAGAAAVSAPAMGDQINLQYTTFGSYDSGVSPPNPAEGTAVANGNSATLTTNASNPAVGAIWMDTGLNTTGNPLTLKFDVEVLSQAASHYGQDFGGAETLGGVRLYDTTASVWAYSFQFMPTSTTGGYFAFRDATNTSVQSIGTYSLNTVYHVELTADYSTHLATASINGGPGVSYALRPGTNVGDTSSEIFTYLNGSVDDSGVGTSNSILIGDALAVPLPSSAWAGMALIGGMGLMAGVKRVRAGVV